MGEKSQVYPNTSDFQRVLSKTNEATLRKSKGGNVLKKKRPETTINERLVKWERTAVLKLHEKSFMQFELNKPYSEMAGKTALSAAKEDRYLGNGKFVINETIQLEKIKNEF